MALIDKIKAIANGFRASRGTEQEYSLDEMAVLAAEKVGGAVPDGTNVTFGNVDGNPVEREEAYSIKSADLNALGAISQSVAGQTALMTIGEMIYALNKAKFIPQGTANSSFSLDFFESNAVGVLKEG